MQHSPAHRLALGALRLRGLAPPRQTVQLGTITLLPHQAAALDWLRPRLARYHGALLADPPGLGKTYVALAVAHESGTVPLIIAPAALRARWQTAAQETGVTVRFISTERLSAPAEPAIAPHQIVIIDEAHHLRTRSTRRYRRTAAACAQATVLLLSATPIQNGVHDLTHITQLFHLPPDRRSIAHLRKRLTLRRTLAQLTAAYPEALARYAMPHLLYVAPPTLPLQHHELLPRLTQLPKVNRESPEAHALLQLGLLHALRSSDAAARERIQNRVAATIAIERATEAGVDPSQSLRRAFRSVDGTVQLAMPQLLGAVTAPASTSRTHGAREQRRELQAMLPHLTGAGDLQRSRVLRRLARWCENPVVAFTQFGSTAATLFQHLRRETGIALLTGSGARIASGKISRAEVLARLLAPNHRTRHNAVRLLITTDVLSEGLSLAGVATVVHLDLPWTAARLEQRIGRAARIGAPVDVVRVLQLAAPLPPVAVQTMHELLDRKRRDMRRGDRSVEPMLVSTLGALRDAAIAADDQRRWITLQSPDLRSSVTLAIVRVHGERLLVALHADTLRAPSSADWDALLRSSETTPGKGAIAALRRALTGWRFDRDLSATVDRSDDKRLRARQEADEALLAGNRILRAVRANAVTLQRRTVMHQTLCHTTTAPDASLTHRESTAHLRSSPPAAGTHGETPRNAGASVRILCGVCILPVDR